MSSAQLATNTSANIRTVKVITQAGTVLRKIRWAIYARKSTEKGLDSPFNSIDSQNYYCEKYIQAQEHDGWYVAGMYSDGGRSGYSTDRSDFQRLLADIKAGLFDGVAVYKSDRFARNLLDALQTIRLFREHNVDFVSVTQKFDTTTAHGRLSMNIMFSFDECYRDASREHTMAKIASSKEKGMWMGGVPPLGYDIKDRKLVINETEADKARLIFKEFVAKQSLKKLALALRETTIRTKQHTTPAGKSSGGNYFTTGALYRLINNPIYIGKVRHKSLMYDGQHEGIISDDIWQATRRVLEVDPKARAGITKRKIPALLTGLLKCGGCSSAMTPTHTRKKQGQLYRYYTPVAHRKAKCVNCPIRQLSAPEIESTVLAQLQETFQAPELIVAAWRSIQNNQIHT